MLYEINEKALKLESEGKKIIRLNLGDPDMATPPEIVEAAYASMKAGKTKYSSSYGELNCVRKSLRLHGVKTENVVITPGSKWAIFRHDVSDAQERRQRHHSHALLDSLRFNCEKFWRKNQAVAHGNGRRLENRP